MALSGNVVKCPAGVLGFDLNKKINRADAKQFYADKYRFCLRYLTRGSDHEAHSDLTEDEADAILDAGLALMAVQHYAGDGWVPSVALGAQYGRRAASNAAQAGLPEGVNVFLDLEGIKQGTTAADVIAYCNAWFDAVQTGGYETGVYVGANCILSSDELYWELHTKHYWKSGSKVPDITQRGYQMVQYIKKGQIDRNVTMDDNFAHGVMWLTRNAPLIS
jgi:Domain of unknown function (DUF1906)